MNGIFHLVAALMLGLLIWWWSGERAKNKLIVDLLKQFAEYQSQKNIEPSVKSLQKIYLKRPLEFAATLCQCFGIPHEMDDHLKPPDKIARINPVPLVGFLLFHQVEKMASQVTPDQKQVLTIWVKSDRLNAEQAQILKTALGGELEISFMEPKSTLEKA